MYVNQIFRYLWGPISVYVVGWWAPLLLVGTNPGPDEGNAVSGLGVRYAMVRAGLSKMNGSQCTVPTRNENTTVWVCVCVVRHHPVKQELVIET